MMDGDAVHQSIIGEDVLPDRLCGVLYDQFFLFLWILNYYKQLITPWFLD